MSGFSHGLGELRLAEEARPFRVTGEPSLFMSRTFSGG